MTRKRSALAGAVVISAVAATTAIAGVPGIANVPDNQTKAVGVAQPNVLSPGLSEVVVARGSMPLENPTSLLTNYGYENDGPFVPAIAGGPEATKTEPDKNTYLVLRGLHGADPSYDYGTHFLFQGHELGLSYITRINLDADAAHRITLLGDTGTKGSLDGGTWDPFAGKLLATGENGSAQGGMWQVGADYPSTVERITAVGSGGYEGVQTDSDGRLWLVADIGGAKGVVNSHARRPNSFIYRFTPARAGDLLAGGKLEALQVLDQAGAPITFTGTADESITSTAVRDLHTYGLRFKTGWVTVHDTATDGSDMFDANALAKAAQATPFKRPENGVFRPGTDFRQFFFTETGDTDLRTEAGMALGGLGGIFRLSQRSPGAASGHLRLLYLGDRGHTGFDNIQFLTRNTVLAVEDAGDTLHTQRGTLDSGYAFDVHAAVPSPVRFLAEGRDPSATIDSARADAATPGHQNDGDNEITGIHVSNGDPTVDGLFGADVPTPWHDGWRVFWTQQHGDNVTWEIVRHERDDDHHAR